ncbi:cytochrome P450 [Astrocystis sublimbata]|nr:cytochrome P450 [Astrocystis sublimbata]
MKSDTLSLFSGLGFALLITYVISRLVLLFNKQNQHRLPPGPKGLLLVGNLNDLPKPGVLEAHHWLRHKALYGPISSVTVFGQSIIIVNDAQLVFELLEKRSTKYSSRPKQQFSGELVGWENTIGLSPYNKRFRAMRKNLSRVIGSNTAAAHFHDVQHAEIAHFLLHVMREPEAFQEHIRKAVGAVILKISYGYTAEPSGPDILIDMAGDAMEKLSRAAVPGAFMVDIFPFLRRLPDWAPGAAFKKLARVWAAELSDVTEKPYAFVRRQMAEGRHEGSFMSRLIETEGSDPEEIETNKWSAMSLYTAGADTTVSAMSCFFLAMTIYPEIQKRSQEEIDRVIGNDRLPTMADRESLPYINAVVKETLRWHPVAPMGLPHECSENDFYDGYMIPKGSMLLIACLMLRVRHFTHDPEVYHDPMAFIPERFIAGNTEKPEPDPEKFVFGFGRRICPGKFLAENSLFLLVVQSLAVFDIGKHGYTDVKNDVKPDYMFQSGIVSHPVPFRSVIRPRSSQHEDLIRSLEQTYPWHESDAKSLERMV